MPFTAYALADGSKRLVWTTFTPQQIDIDVGRQVTRDYLLGVLDQLAAAGVSRVRLDAVGYAVKTPGLSCFMTPRNSHPAFEGVFEVSASGAHLHAAWTNGHHVARLTARLDSGEGLLQWTTPAGGRQAALTDLAHRQFTVT